jgi:intracellular septation protein
MNDRPLKAIARAPNKKPTALNHVLDFGPLLLFVTSNYALKHFDVEGAIFKAAIIFAIAAILAAVISKFKFGMISNLLILTTIIIILSATLANLTGSPLAIYMKPTVLNSLVGLIIVGSVKLKKNAVKPFMGSFVSLPDRAWDILAYRWSLYFFAYAISNEIVWRNFGEDVWLLYNLFATLPVLIFGACQIPFIRRNKLPEI